MKYIITWCLLVNAEIPQDPQPDKFGRVTNIQYTVLPMHPEPHAEEFFNRDSALMFMRECKMQNNISNVSFDSVVRGEE